MNIVVCVKYVPDATANRQFESDNTVDRVGVDGLLSELDEYAVEQALQLKEKADGEDVEITALTIGPEGAAEAIKKALQMGADKGVHVVDDAIAGSDAIATSLVLAEAIKKAGGGSAPDLVVSVGPDCGSAYGVDVTVRNVGQAAVPAGVLVSVYTGKPGASQILGALTTSQTLYPAESESFLVQADTSIASDTVYAVVDDAGPPHSWVECRTDNNQSAVVSASCKP